MLLEELKEQIYKLSPIDRLALLTAIIESLQETPISQSDRSAAIKRMRGLLKTDQPAPTDEEVAAMLEEQSELTNTSQSNKTKIYRKEGILVVNAELPESFDLNSFIDELREERIQDQMAL